MEHKVVGKLRARVAAWRHGNPARGLKLIAVAGASGKTTTTLLLGEILQEAGNSVITLTSHGCYHNGQPITRKYDTSADAMQHCLGVAKKKNVDYVVIEISDALVGTQVLPTLLITMSVITNESPSAQVLLNEPVDYAVIPSDMTVAGLAVAPHQVISFGEGDDAEAQVTKVTERRRGTEVELVIDHQTKLAVATYLIGKANAMNVAAAVSAAYVLAADTATFPEGVARLERVAGNYDYLPSGDRPYDMVVDGASSDLAVERTLQSASALAKRRLLIAADSTVPDHLYPILKQQASRSVVVSDMPEFPGVERVDTMQAALELITRGAKKNDLVLLLGHQFAALHVDGLTEAHHMLKAGDE